MLQILIITEDDFAAKKIWKKINELNPELNLAATITNADLAIDWLKQQPAPACIFSALHIGGVNALQIFQQADTRAPFVLITPHNPYAVKFFKEHNMLYLEKPIKVSALETIVRKITTGDLSPGKFNFQQLPTLFSPPDITYKKKFVVRKAGEISTVSAEKIAYVYTINKTNYLVTLTGDSFETDYHLDSLDRMLDPALFFRINRQFIVAVKAITGMENFSKNRIQLQLKPPCDQETIVSAARVSAFKKWIQPHTDL